MTRAEEITGSGGRRLKERGVSHDRRGMTEPAHIRTYIDRLQRLSTIPGVLQRIMEITDDPGSSFEDLRNVISHDPSLAERVVRVANASCFGHSGCVGDIDQAVMFLGYEHIRDISLGMGVLQILGVRQAKNLRGFWLHCYEVALISGMVAERITMLSPETAFLAGLLHDTGRLVFLNLAPGNCNVLYGTDDLIEREVGAFGCDHALAGSWLAEKAQLPAEHVAAIRYHHAPSQAGEYHDLVSAIALSETLSRRFYPKIEDDGVWTSEHDAILLELGMSNYDIDDMRIRLGYEENEAQHMLEAM